ncbi:peroxin Pex14/17-Penicillium chrysogenum [Penicillium longicatenatum]|uniref:peroxin Pex14/17-Penicillium chrysogenum n=1 Tax=Penicillium longicatenatum TaxID=1561947 RepID=UPI002549690C|nr:peroxin Pex14/17-Penicillium chrysogenum [Penicillium longicatenatum]KAJ5643386.1 peroxin Pex14/17-Penicillium chrysogenum [Penicillium longicatenatum]
MSDSKKPPSIPAWQRQAASPPDQSPPQSSPSPSSDDAPAPTSREDLINQASRFLEDESIRDSSTDRKVAFLESKGLNSDEIQQLLGVSRNLEATSNASTDDNAQDTPQTSPASSEIEVAPSPDTAQSSSPSPSPSTTMSQQRTPTATTPSPTKRDEPPIITYPEFLFEPTKPPPLVTMQSVLYTLYGAAGLGASIYGASEYIVKPMLATLTSARQELAETAQENLQKLNEKLEKTVSVIPPHLKARKDNDDEEDEESDSVTSDPTELFHRDMGTQTTPDVSSSHSLASTKEGEEKLADAPSIAVSNHMSRLESIQSQLKEVDGLEKESSTLDDNLRSKMSDLHHYLDGLIYAAPAYTAAGGSYGLYGNTSSGTDGSSSGVRKAEDEAIASFKADIRGVKGALLSARNFPASRSGRLGGYAAGAR